MAKGRKGRRKPQADDPSANTAERNKTPVNPGAKALKTAAKGTSRKNKGPSKATDKRIQTQAQLPINSKKMASSPGIERYGMLESRERLLRCGFHPEVTDLTPVEYEENWIAWNGAEARRETREYFFNEAETLNRVSRAPWVSWDAPKKDNQDNDADDDSTAAIPGLQGFLQHPHAGPLMIEMMFKDGRKTALKLARTSHSMWEIVASNVNIWNYTTGSLEKNGFSRVFVVTTPNYTIGEVLRARMDHPYGLDDGPQHPDAWKFQALDVENNIFENTKTIYRRLKNMTQLVGATITPERIAQVERYLDEDIVKAVESLNPNFMNQMWKANQFVGMPHGQLFTPPVRFGMTRLKQMMAAISAQRQGITVLHFHSTPLLDRRMLAIILRACPNVVMVGVYNCPLIHFGDVVCLLDLIHEINTARREEKRAEIKAFDFFPYFNDGMPYQHPWGGVYGLTWGPKGQDVVQRGFFTLLLKAFMKAKAMGLELLFDKGKAFMDYLHKVPFPALSVPTFLDAMYRYLSIDENTPNHKNEEKKAIYDLLKAVRVGIDFRMERDWPRWYIQTMGQHPLFCSCCGYAMLQEFFTAAGVSMRPHDRICSGCTLQIWLDNERDHLKFRKRNALDKLCPNWNPEAFNLDAPIDEKGHKLINLKTTEVVRLSSPAIYFGSNGGIHIRFSPAPLVRDNKLVSDSLQSLPTLSELTEGDKVQELWSPALRECNKIDMYCRAMRQLKIDLGDRQPPKGYDKVVGGMLDHVDEVQPHREEGTMTFPTAGAIMLTKGIRSKGW